MSIRTSFGFARILFSVLLGAITVCAIGCGEGKTQVSGKGKTRVLEPVKVDTAQSAPATTRPYIRITGTLYAFEDVTISAKVAGRIVRIDHDLGDHVEPGQPLAQIDRIDYELAVKERQSAIRATLAKLGLTAFPSEDLLVDEVPSVKRTLVQLNNVGARYERLKQLFDQKPPLISEQEYADAETEFKVARSAFEVEKANAQALLAEALTLQADLNLANQRLADTEIKTPTPGSTIDPSAALSSLPGATTLFDDADKVSANPQVRYAVAERFVSLGEYVREGTPLYRLIDEDPVKMRAMVPERYAGQVSQDLQVTVTVQAHDKPYTGKISRISPLVDPASRTFVVEVLIPNPDSELKPGAFASATIVLPAELPAVRVPLNAVTSFAGIHKVFTVKEGKAVENRVTLGERNGDSVLIMDGLSANEQIVLAPPSQMVGGTPLILSPATDPGQ